MSSVVRPTNTTSNRETRGRVYDQDSDEEDDYENWKTRNHIEIGWGNRSAGTRVAEVVAPAASPSTVIGESITGITRPCTSISSQILNARQGSNANTSRATRVDARAASSLPSTGQAAASSTRSAPNVSYQPHPPQLSTVRSEQHRPSHIDLPVTPPSLADRTTQQPHSFLFNPSPFPTIPYTQAQSVPRTNPVPGTNRPAPPLTYSSRSSLSNQPN
jgi:hypothetical protein